MARSSKPKKPKAHKPKGKKTGASIIKPAAPRPVFELPSRPLTADGAAVFKVLQLLDKAQWWPHEQMLAAQFKALAALLNHARESVPYYHERLAALGPFDARGLAAGGFAAVPVLERATVNEQAAGLVSNKIPKAHGNLDPIFTSGTTGQPVRVLRTTFALTYWSGFTIREHIWHKRLSGATLAVIRSSKKGVSLYPKGGMSSTWGGDEDIVIRSGPRITLNTATAVADIAEWLDREQPDYLLALPNLIRRLAPFCIENKIRLPNLKEVQTHGEILTDHLREQVRRAWDVPIHANYSSREVGYMAMECPDHPHYHVQSEGVYLEVLDDAGRPCGPGETGRVIVTTLHNLAMPLIRYAVGDRAEVGEPCPCGRGLPVLNKILGREQDVLILPNGEQRWTLLGSPDIKELMGMAPIRQYQFAHVATETLEVRLAVAEALTAEQESRIADWIRKKFAYDFQVRFVYRETLPLTKAGKFRDFVDER